MVIYLAVGTTFWGYLSSGSNPLLGITNDYPIVNYTAQALLRVPIILQVSIALYTQPPLPEFFSPMQGLKYFLSKWMDFEECNNIKGIWKIATQSQKVMTLGLHRFFFHLCFRNYLFAYKNGLKFFIWIFKVITNLNF